MQSIKFENTKNNLSLINISYDSFAFYALRSTNRNNKWHDHKFHAYNNQGLTEFEKNKYENLV